MRRPVLVYVLIAAVVAASASLAYYGYSSSRELSMRERAVIIDTTHELAEEKIHGIESEIIKSDNAVFRRVDISNRLELQDIFKSQRTAIESVLILDGALAITPDGFFTARSGDNLATFRRLFQERVVPDLDLPSAELNQRGHLHEYYDGRPYLFSYMRQVVAGKTFYIVLEADLDYLVSTVFPQFFTPLASRRYQVVDSAGDLVYGFDFTSAREEVVVEVRFSQTVSRWRLRVAQPDAGTLASGSSRQVVDLVLIGSALAIILIGLAILLWGLYREQRANALKSEFISNVSHELKTPLSIISMFGEMLALGRTKSSEQATEYAEIIWRESVRLSRLIDNVLDFAKIERGLDVYEFAEGDVAEVVERAIELSFRRTAGADVEIAAEIADDLPVVQIDSNALTLAVLNLIDNAIKYAASAKRIEVSLGKSGDRVVLSVRDFGPGIEPDEQARIFARFYRARAVRLKPIRGSGIGLALVRHVAEAHGGGVEVSSTPGHGATFRLWIPDSTRR